MKIESVPETARQSALNVLVVEDDIEIRHILATRLREFGFTVCEGSNAAEALRLIHAAIHFDAVITDVEMPGDMNGIALAEQIRAGRPDVKIIVVSGTNVDQEVRRRGMRFFMKPYDLSSLVEFIKECSPT